MSVTCAIVGAEELKARWAYVEISSSRFGPALSKRLSPELCEQARRLYPFEQIPRQAWPELIAALKAVRTAGFVDLIDTAGSETYQALEWSMSDLLGCVTLPVFGAGRFFQFLALPILLDKAGNPRGNDPRHISSRIPLDSAFRPRDPIIAVRKADRFMLLEGYLRCILWLRYPNRPLNVWVPKL